MHRESFGPVRKGVLAICVATCFASTAASQERQMLSVVYDANGNVDSSFLGGGEVWTTLPDALGISAEAVVRDQEGRVLVTGGIELTGISVLVVARYLPTGVLDATFGFAGIQFFDTEDIPNAGTSRGYDLLVDPRDQKLVVVGYLELDEKNKLLVYKLTPDGKPDVGFGQQGKAYKTVTYGNTTECEARGVALDGEGRYVVAGHVSYISTSSQNPETDFAVVRFFPDGKRDKSLFPSNQGRLSTKFPPAKHAQAEDIGIVQIGDEERIVVGGWARGAFPVEGGGTSPFVFALARYRPDGVLDSGAGGLPGFGGDGRVTTDFGADTVSRIEAIYTDGREVYAAGAASAHSAEQSVFAVAHYFEDGALDPNFGSGGKKEIQWGQGASSATAIAHQPRVSGVTDGGIVVAGVVGSPPTGFGVTRLGPGGSIDPGFGQLGMSYHDSPIWSLPTAGDIDVERGSGALWLAGGAFIGGELEPVTTIPLLKFDLAWDPDYDDVDPLVQLCEKFQERVYDITDGQLSVDRFSLRGAYMTEKGQAPFSQVLTGEALGEMIHPEDDPESQEPLDLDAAGPNPWPGERYDPELFRVVVPDAAAPSDSTVGRMVASWLTGQMGHGPESMPYVKNGQLELFPGCPLATLGDSDACIMSSSSATELCLPANHSPKTPQGVVRGVSCYEWLATALQEPQFVVPSVELEGPDASPPHWTLIRGRDVISEDMDVAIHVVKENGELQGIDAQRGLVLMLPSGKRLELAFSMYAKHKKHSGYGNGKIVATVEGGPIESLQIDFQHCWNGKKVSEFTGENMWGWTAHPGGHASATHTLTKKTKYILQLEATANDVSEIHWQFHHAVRFGGWRAGVSSNTTAVDIVVVDDGEAYATTLEGHYSLNWGGGVTHW